MKEPYEPKWKIKYSQELNGFSYITHTKIFVYYSAVQNKWNKWDNGKVKPNICINTFDRNVNVT